MTLTAQINELIDQTDNSSLVLYRIGEILLVESENQIELAENAEDDPPDPKLYRLRVFLERSNPWEEFKSAADSDIDADPEPEQIDATPIVNISLDSVTYDKSKSNVVERQLGVGIFHIDCYGYGASTDDGDDEGGHDPGDARAALEAQRAATYVRKMLMAGAYTYLGQDMRSACIVWGSRWLDDIKIFQPQIEGRHVQHVVGARLALSVPFNEFSPQVQGETIEAVSIGVKRKETGELYFTAAFEYGA